MNKNATKLAKALYKHAYWGTDAQSMGTWDTDAQAMHAWAKSPEGVAFRQGAHDGALATGQGATTAANDVVTLGTGIGKAVLGAPLVVGDRLLRNVAPEAARGIRETRRAINNQADRIRAWSTRLRDKAHTNLNSKMYDSSDPALNASRAGGQIAATALTAAIPVGGGAALGARATQGALRAVGPVSWRVGNSILSTAGRATAQLLSKVPGAAPVVNAIAPRIGAAFKATEPIRNIGSTAAGVVWPYVDKVFGVTQKNLDDSDYVRYMKQWARKYPQYVGSALNPAVLLNNLFRSSTAMADPIEESLGYVASNHLNSEYNPNSVVDTLANDVENILFPYGAQVLDYANEHPNMPLPQLWERVQDSFPSTVYTRVLGGSPVAGTVEQWLNKKYPYRDKDNPSRLRGAAHGALSVLGDSDRAARSAGGEALAQFLAYFRAFNNNKYPTDVILK